MGVLTDAAAGRGIGGIARSELAKRIAKSKEVLVGAMRRLGHPHVPAYEGENIEVLEKQVLLAARFYVETWPGATKPHVIDVAAMAVLKAGLDASLVHRVFGGVSLESDLTAPTETWLRKGGFQVKREVKVRDSRADLVGYTKGLFERKILLIELKNVPEECQRLAGQVSDYRRAGDTVRVIMTPECHANIVLSRNELDNPRAYEDVISKMGAELWIYDATSEEFEKLVDGSSSYENATYDALWAELTQSKSIA